MGKLKFVNNTSSLPRSDKHQTNSAEELEAADISKKIVQLALDQKALDVVGYDVRAVSSLARYIIIASGTSSRHVKGICDKIKEGLDPSGIRPLRIDGYDEGEWVILDYDDIIIHLFYEPKRQYYQFDSLMNGAEKLELDEELKTQVRQFKTGLHAL